ncbi:MAG TPA: MerR family transcriptional regulator [Trebonia sp.]|jgi:DNA-binding transcriptional MerR regulator
MMRIGELAARTGVSPRSLRYYEQQGLLHTERSANGWRIYPDAAVPRVRKIAEMLDNGLTIEGIQELADCLEMRDPSECDDPGHALETYQARLAVVRDRLAALQHHHDKLTGAIEELRR